MFTHTHTHTHTQKVLFSGINIQTRTGARSPLRLSWWCAGQMAEPHTHHNPHTQHGRVFLSIWGKIQKKKNPSSVFLPRTGVEFTPVDGVRETAVHGGGKV